MSDHTWKKKLSTFFNKEELEEIEAYGLQARIFMILCYEDKDCELRDVQSTQLQTKRLGIE